MNDPDSGKKEALIITVGTSLFTSASWSEQLTVTGYQKEWLTRKSLRSPSRRSRSPSSPLIEANIKRLLISKTDDALDCLVNLDEESVEGNRFSAELSTLLAIASLRRRPISSLLSNYQEVILVASNDTANDSRIAADFLGEALNRLGNAKNAKVCGIETKTMEDLRKNFDQLLRDYKSGTDLVISGGYKIYATLAGMWLGRVSSDSTRIYYLYENGEMLVEQRVGVVETIRTFSQTTPMEGPR